MLNAVRPKRQREDTSAAGRHEDAMAKAKARVRHAARAERQAAAAPRRPQAAAMPRSMQNRGEGDSRKAVQQPARGRAARRAPMRRR